MNIVHLFEILIIIAIVVAIIVLQRKQYGKTKDNISRLVNTLIAHPAKYLSVDGNTNAIVRKADKAMADVSAIDDETESQSADEKKEVGGGLDVDAEKDDEPVPEEFAENLSEINAYLVNNNSGVIDCQVIKDFLDRKISRLEESIDTTISIPLYLGLCATISGIVVGLIFLGIRGVNDSNITGLLVDVAVAMLASFTGVLFTVMTTHSYSESLENISEKRNDFLNWLQMAYQPGRNDSFSAALMMMTSQLNDFNDTFKVNTSNLRRALNDVNSNYDKQIDIIKAVQSMDLTAIASNNLEVAKTLGEIKGGVEDLLEVFSDSKEYLSTVNALNQRLGDIEERVKLSEDLGEYFKSENQYVKDRQSLVRGLIDRQTSEINIGLNEFDGNLGSVVRNIKDSSEKAIGAINASFNDLMTKLDAWLEQQNKQTEDIIMGPDSPTRQLEAAIDAVKAEISKAINVPYAEQFNRLADRIVSAMNTRSGNDGGFDPELSSTIKNLNDNMAELLQKMNQRKMFVFSFGRKSRRNHA